MFKLKEVKTEPVIKLFLQQSANDVITLNGTDQSGSTWILMEFHPNGTYSRVGGLYGVPGLQTEVVLGSSIIKEDRPR